MDRIQYLDGDDGAVFAAAPNVATTLPFARFTAWCGAVTGIGLLCVMLFVAVIDPYNVIGLAEIAGVNQVKPQPEQYQEQIKLAQVAAIRPDMLFLGNSRTEIGFDPDSPHVRASGRSAYNLALSGTSLTVSERMLEHARTAAAVPATAVVGAEFLDFLVEADAPPPAAPGAAPFSWQWRFDTLFSLNALADAITTVRIQKASDPQTMTARGHNPLYEYRRFARQEGYFSIFQQRAQEYAKKLVHKPHNLVVGKDGPSESTVRLRRMLDRMAADGTEVHLVIYPYHAQLMALFEEAGLAPTLQAWKRLLVDEADAARQRHAGARISVWDFSGYTPVQCERIPAAGDTRATTRWYWEAGHFKSGLGELMLQRMLGGTGTLGTPLTAGNLEQNAARIAAERAQCAAAYPDVFAQAHRLAAGARRP